MLLSERDKWCADIERAFHKIDAVKAHLEDLEGLADSFSGIPDIKGTHTEDIADLIYAIRYLRETAKDIYGSDSYLF